MPRRRPGSGEPSLPVDASMLQLLALPSALTLLRMYNLKHIAATYHVRKCHYWQPVLLHTHPHPFCTTLLCSCMKVSVIYVEHVERAKLGLLHAN